MPEKTLKSILDDNLSDCNLTVCLASYAENQKIPEFQKLVLAQDLAAEFRRIPESTIEQLKRGFGSPGFSLLTYDPGIRLGWPDVEYIDLRNYPSIRNKIPTVRAIRYCPTFSNDESFVSQLRFYVINLRPARGDPINCFRFYTQKMVLSYSTLFGFLYGGAAFDSLSQPTFLFDRNIDCISRGNHMFIFSKDKFQKQFRFTWVIRQTGVKILEQLKRQDLIFNFDDFRAACKSDTAKLSKLNRIAAKLKINKIKIEDLIRVTNKLKLPIAITSKNRKKMLVYNPNDKWVLLHLLDDDYLKSMMTNRIYEVSSKRLYR